MMLAHWIVDGITAVPTEFIVLALGVFMAILGWIGRNAKQELDEHLKECNLRRINEASALSSLDERVESIEKSSTRIDRNVVWLGDYIITLGTGLQEHVALKVKLPERPE